VKKEMRKNDGFGWMGEEALINYLPGRREESHWRKIKYTYKNL
jgi:hypothetical protein